MRLREKLAALEALGVDGVLCLHFDAQLAAMPREQFVERLLIQGLGVRQLVVGPDFRFGHRRLGDVEYLKTVGSSAGFGVEAMPPLLLDGERVSSTAVRRHLSGGDLAGAARLLGLTADQAAEAFGIAAVQHIQSNEIESSATNRRGDLTMWKRFHGADIMRHAVDACLLALSGAEGAVRPFQGRLGFLAVFGAEGDPLPLLREKLRPEMPMLATARTDMKRWPVGSRGQSAIRAAIEARRKLPDGARIAAVRVATEEDVYNHLVRIRTDPWRPQSRETADHSLPYIVGTAVLDGFVNVSSFNLEKVLDPDRARFIAEKVAIEVDPALTAAGAGTSRNTSRVEIVTEDGDIYSGAPLPGPGHHENPFDIGDLSEKFHENADGLLGHSRIEVILSIASSLAAAKGIHELTNSFSLN
jgi:2-methylcitrate dehydratase